ncbi:MAG: Trk system potassium transporter TrkA [Oscillospiraceae bacterium]|nr:Trk system potassium transporter TrkA [Oscillospiraceae bacterium]
MKIAIIGLGTIGKTILKNLSVEGHTITIIDEDKTKIEALIEKYDVFGVVGNVACMDIQKEAKMKDDLGIAMIVNPEQEMASEIFNIINLPSVNGIEHFANGRVSLVEVAAEKGCRLIGETLISLGQKLATKVLICAVQRGDEVIIPAGRFIIREGDRIHFTADAKSLGDFLSEVNLVKSPFKNVMIIGGGRIGYYLADALSKKKYAVKLIEDNPYACEELAELLPRATVVCGNGTQHDVLLEEGIEAMDAFVALTDIDEENMIVSMFANKKKVKKSITQIKNDDLYGMLDELGINNNVSPKHIVAGRIISYIRALANTVGSRLVTLYQLVNNQVEALEFAATKKEAFYDKPLRELNMKKNSLIACIIRQNEVIIPDGNSEIHLGDNVVVVTTHKNFDDLNDVIE